MTDTETAKFRADGYALARDAETVLAFAKSQAAWIHKIRRHQVDPTFEYSVRSMPTDSAKWAAYDAGHRIACLLGEPGPHSVEALVRLAALAIIR